MLLCVTASHKTAPFELLERLSVHTATIAPLVVSNDDSVCGAVVVATCNRFEAYVDTDDSGAATAVEAVLLAIESATGVTAEHLDGSYLALTGDAVAEHLFAVASGLESVVVGEGEIAGQVRRALADARRDGAVTPELERLFQRASEAQRGVKNATALSRAGRSLVRLALDLADSRIADWTPVRVVLVGTGSYAATTVAALREYGAADISVYSPSGRAGRFAAKHGLRALPDDQWRYAAANADVLIACTSTETPVIASDVLATRDRGGSRQLIIDLGLPRNVDPAVAALDIDLLDLETIRLHAPLEELQATDAARQVVRDAARRFTSVGEQRNAVPAVVALRSHVLALLEQEIARGRARDDDDRRTEQALRHFAGVLLHDPTTRAHDLAAQGRADEVASALETLFGLRIAAATDARGELAG